MLNSSTTILIMSIALNTLFPMTLPYLTGHTKSQSPQPHRLPAPLALHNQSNHLCKDPTWEPVRGSSNLNSSTPSVPPSMPSPSKSHSHFLCSMGIFTGFACSLGTISPANYPNLNLILLFLVLFTFSNCLSNIASLSPSLKAFLLKIKIIEL